MDIVSKMKKKAFREKRCFNQNSFQFTEIPCNYVYTFRLIYKFHVNYIILERLQGTLYNPALLFDVSSLCYAF